MWSTNRKSYLGRVPAGLDSNTGSHEFKHAMLIGGTFSRNHSLLLKGVLRLLLESFKEEASFLKQ